MQVSSSYMCRGKEWDCRLEDAFDPDIAGTGIIVSFFATAVLTFLALVYGYVRGILPGVHMGNADHMLLRPFSSRRGGTPHDTQTYDPIRQRVLEESMERFILGLSDQQLITGLALLIACYIRCDVSLYSQGLVAASAWFSYTTHLATITVLERYFINHAVLRHIRVSCMLLVAIGVVTSEVLSPDIANSDRPLAFYCAVADSTLTGFFESVFASLGTAIMSFFLIESYLKRAIALYCRPVDNEQSSWASNLRLLAGLTDGNQGAVRLRPPEKNLQLPLYQLVAIAVSEIRHCFLNAISGMLFMGSFAVVQLLTAWRAVNFDSTGESWTFGQLVPLLLLVIPMLGAGELLSGRNLNRRRLRHVSLPAVVELRKRVAHDDDLYRWRELRSVADVPSSSTSSRTLLPDIEAVHETIRRTLSLQAGTAREDQYVCTRPALISSRSCTSTFNSTSATTTWCSDDGLPTAKGSTSQGIEIESALYQQIRFRTVLYMLMICWPTASILAGAILAGWYLPGNDALIVLLGSYIVVVRPLTNVLHFYAVRRGRIRRRKMNGLLRVVPGVLAWSRRAREATREQRQHHG